MKAGPIKFQPTSDHVRPAVALEKRLRNCARVVTLGVRPNYSDYPEDEKQLIFQASRIYYPSSLYADMFAAMGKSIFPSHATYRFAQDKIKQTLLFQMSGIPHPRTRIFFGKRQKLAIGEHFDLPLIAKTPRGSALGRGVFLIRSIKALNQYCINHPTAYIQEYLPIDRDMRIVVIGRRVAHAYWRIAPRGDHRTNVAAGGSIDLSPVPDAAKQLALETAQTCGWNDVGIDICQSGQRYYVLEANMKYGLEGFRRAGIDYTELMEQLIDHGEI